MKRLVQVFTFVAQTIKNFDYSSRWNNFREVFIYEWTKPGNCFNGTPSPTLNPKNNRKLSR